MGKIIIHTKNVTDADAVDYVATVIEMGKVSGKQYCYHVSFKDEVDVTCESSREGLYTFYVEKRGE